MFQKVSIGAGLIMMSGCLTLLLSGLFMFCLSSCFEPNRELVSKDVGATASLAGAKAGVRDGSAGGADDDDGPAPKELMSGADRLALPEKPQSCDELSSLMMYVKLFAAQERSFEDLQTQLESRDIVGEKILGVFKVVFEYAGKTAGADDAELRKYFIERCNDI